MKLNFTKIYSVIGKVLCGLGGAIIGFVTGGIAPAFLGIILGVAAGYLLDKSIVKPFFKN